MTGPGGAGTVMGHHWGPGCPRVLASPPGNTRAGEDSSWCQREAGGAASSSQTTCGWDPLIFGCRRTQTTEMTYLQPLSAVGFLPSFPVQPLAGLHTHGAHSCLLWAPHCSTTRSAQTPPVSSFLGALLPCRTAFSLLVEAPCH